MTYMPWTLLALLVVAIAVPMLSAGDGQHDLDAIHEDRLRSEQIERLDRRFEEAVAKLSATVEWCEANGFVHRSSR